MSGLTLAQKVARLGYFNASTVEALLKPKGLGDTGMTYLFKKAAERDTGEPQGEPFINAEMQWGIDHEEEAIAKVSELLGVQLYKNDLTLKDEKLNLAGTPDVLILKDYVFGFEIKCPSSYRHLMYRQIKDAATFKKELPSYYWQCVSYMHLSGISQWTFVSYDPRNELKKLHLLTVEPLTGDIDFFIERLTTAKELLLSL